jgi:hypothetical protein
VVDTYSQDAKASTQEKLEPVPFVVYERGNPEQFVVGKSVTWLAARTDGAAALSKRTKRKLVYEDVYAVRMWDGETPSQAVQRGVGLDSMWRRTQP